MRAAAEPLIAAARRGDQLDELANLVAAIMPSLLNSEHYLQFFQTWQAHGFHVTPAHFYYPIPDTSTLDENVWSACSGLVGVDMNDTGQLALLAELQRFNSELDAFGERPTDCPFEFHFENRKFDWTDAMVLYSMVRHFQPNLIIEVGSGYSSRMSAHAALRNGHSQLICIEPYPDEVLIAGFPGLTALVKNKVQDVPTAVFQQLGPGDILFIDSSHVVKIGSDVNYLFLEVLPRLQPGVIVHVHDIHLPMNYPRDWVRQTLFWNEQYLLHAFLLFNQQFEVLLANAYLGHRYPAELTAAFPRSPWTGGGSFWMRRKGS